MVDLNGNTTAISSLTFTNYTSSDNKTKQVSFNFTITDNYTNPAQQYSDSTTIESSAEVRNN